MAGEHDGLLPERGCGHCRSQAPYPDNTVQHAGVVVGIAGFAGHILTGYDRYPQDIWWRLATTQDESAVTGACLMVKRSVFRGTSWAG